MKLARFPRPLPGRRCASGRHPAGAWLAPLFAIALLVVLAAGPARAQEATPAGPSATPRAQEATCALPIPADAPTSDGTGGVRPPASPVASPVAPAEPDVALTRALSATAAALAACLTEGEIDTATLLTSDASRGQLVSGGIPLTPDAFAALMPTLPSVAYGVVTVDDAVFTDQDRASATVTYMVANQVLAGVWQFVALPVEGEQRWVVDAIEPQPVEVPNDAVTIEVETRQGEYGLSDDEVSGSTVALEVSNNDEQEHEVLVLVLEEGIEVDALLAQPGPSLPEGMTYIGDLVVPAGEEGTLLLTGLEPGTYTIVDLLPDADGLPHLASGEVATFTVEGT